jgi:uncharacterized membrane protein
MKKSLTTGLVILLPFALTLWVVTYLFDLFTDPLFHFLEKLLLAYEKQQGMPLLHHEMVVSFLSRIAALVLTFFLIVLLGFLARRFFFDASLKLFQRLTLHIPIVGTVYRLSKELTKAIFSSDQKAFKETVLTPFPSSETYTIGFVTGEPPSLLKAAVPTLDTTLFVPTAPHPISGYVLFCSRNSLKSLSISVEETFKYLISCGVAPPHQ